MISVLFWSLETILFGAGLSIILTVYDVINPATSSSYLDLQLFYTGCYVFVSFASLICIIDAFRRLKKCLEHDQLGISSKQIVIHVTIFTLSLLAMSLFSSLSFTVQIGDPTYAQLSERVHIDLITAELTVIILCLSSVPILLIMNALINKTIKDNLEQE